MHTRPTLRIRISECTHDEPSGYGSPLLVKYSDILEHTTNPQDTDLRSSSNIPIFYNNNAAHFAARRILCQNAPYVCMPYPASSTPISTTAAHLRSFPTRISLTCARERTNEPAITCRTLNTKRSILSSLSRCMYVLTTVRETDARAYMYAASGTQSG